MRCFRGQEAPQLAFWLMLALGLLSACNLARPGVSDSSGARLGAADLTSVRSLSCDCGLLLPAAERTHYPELGSETRTQLSSCSYLADLNSLSASSGLLSVRIERTDDPMALRQSMYEQSRSLTNVIKTVERDLAAGVKLFAVKGRDAEGSMQRLSTIVIEHRGIRITTREVEGELADGEPSWFAATIPEFHRTLWINYSGACDLAAE